jgi:hypothetical protein
MGGVGVWCSVYRPRPSNRRKVLPYLLLFVGIAMALRGHFPGLFAKHIESRLIAGTPYRRTESVTSWSITAAAAVLLASLCSLVQAKLAPENPDIAKTVIDGVKKAITPPPPPAPAPSLTPAPIPEPASEPKPHVPEKGKAPSDTAVPPSLAKSAQLKVMLFDPNDPVIRCENISDTVAQNVTWELVMFRESDYAYFSYTPREIGYVKPHDKSAAYTLDLNRLQHAGGDEEIPGGDQLRRGDVLTGTLVVDCPVCTGTTLTVHFVWGESGWFYEVPGANGKFPLPQASTKAAVQQLIVILKTFKGPAERTIISKH